MNSWFGRLLDALSQDFAQRFTVQKCAHALHAFAEVMLTSLLVIVLAYLVILLARRSLARLETRVENLHGALYRRRIETATSLIVSTIQYAVYIAAILGILAIWGVNTTSLAFGTAALGAAVGFGSQGLVQDVITGLSILAEDQLAVGDFVEIAGKSGAVEEVGLRVIKIRDHLGAQHVIFNRTITLVSNFTSGAVQAHVDISLQDAQSGEAATLVATKVCQDMSRELPYFVEMPVVEGIRESSTNDVFLRLNLKVFPQQDGVISTLFVERLKRAFAAAKIPIPENGIRVVILSDLFKKAVNRVHPSALPAASEKTFEGAV